MDGISQEEMRGRYQQIPDFDSHLARGRGGLQCRPYRRLPGPQCIHGIQGARDGSFRVLLGSSCSFIRSEHPLDTYARSMCEDIRNTVFSSMAPSRPKSFL